eukprot:scaffold7942_cov111-Cylindrotheca_fusiformis.AAC.3
MQVVLVVVAVTVFYHVEKDIGSFSTLPNATTVSKPPHMTISAPPTRVPYLAPSETTAPPTDNSEASPSPIPSVDPTSVDFDDDDNNDDDELKDTSLDETDDGETDDGINDDDGEDEDGGDGDDDQLSEHGDSDEDENDDDHGLSSLKPTPTNAPVQYLEKNLTLPDISLSQKEQEFSQQRCDLTALKSWYPSIPENSWEYRAPYVIIAGVWNSGSKNLAQRLYTHPQISKEATKASGFYKPANFYTFSYPNPKVYAARQRMYAQAYNAGILQSSSNTVAMDVSPGYLFYAQKVSHSILCMSPWTKIVILLRNPIERLYEQYARAKQTSGLRISLEQWIANEMQLITSSGLREKEADSEEEKEAWKKYQSKRNMANAIGRSLYVIQLQEWLETYKEAGKDPKKEIYIVPSEVLEQEDTFQEEYNKLLSFLRLSNVRVSSSVKPRDPALSEMTEHMTAETRRTLEKFFKPYNKRLFKLLEDEGFPEYQWKTLWQRKS